MKGWPTNQDVWRLASLLMCESEGALNVELVDEEDSLTWLYPDGTADIEISAWDSPQEQAGTLLEELGHWVLTHWWPVVNPPQSARASRIFRQNDARDEAKIRQFVLAWKYPTAQVVRCRDVFALMRAARCSPADAEERWRMVMRH